MVDHIHPPITPNRRKPTPPSPPGRASSAGIQPLKLPKLPEPSALRPDLPPSPPPSDAASAGVGSVGIGSAGNSPVGAGSVGNSPMGTGSMGNPSADNMPLGTARPPLAPIPPASGRSPQPAATQRSQPTETRPRRLWKRSRRRGGWSSLFLGVTAAFGGLGAAALLWLGSLPPPIDCRDISPLSADIERLQCAREAAHSGDESDLLAGLALVESWSPGHPLYNEAQQLVSDWSGAILRMAEQKFEQSDLDGAIALARKIPADSPAYPQAQAAIAAWQQEWSQGETIYNTAVQALRDRDWNLASEQILALGNIQNDYWRVRRVDELTQKVLAEKTAWQAFDSAQKLFDEGALTDPDKLGEAIALVQQIDPKSYAWADAKASLEQWTQSLLEIGLSRWQAGDKEGAIAIAQHIPADLITNPIAQDLIRYSQAHELANQSPSTWEPSWQQVIDLMEALAALRQIQPDSPFYAEAQANRVEWEAQLKDLQQLQTASFMASLGQRATFDLAIAQASQISGDRPRRLQAQTLIAHWGQQIQRIDDQPYLLLARDVASSGIIADLQKAMSIAAYIPQGRALWDEAQAAIAQWQGQIETIQDKPILEEAQDLAQKGELRQAIRVASRIDSDRALHEQAQAAIAIWRTKIRETQIAQDRPILDEAHELAAKERYTLAIERASAIEPERALYDEARSAIATWRDRRAELRARWEAEAATTYGDPAYSGTSNDSGYSEPVDSYVAPADDSFEQQVPPYPEN